MAVVFTFTGWIFFMAPTHTVPVPLFALVITPGFKTQLQAEWHSIAIILIQVIASVKYVCYILITIRAYGN